MQRDISFVADIVDAAQLIQSYLYGIDLDEFFEDLMRQDAVIRELMVIGEATKQLSGEFKVAHTDVPWRNIAGTRDFLVHSYRHIDVKEVWRISTVDVPGCCVHSNPCSRRSSRSDVRLCRSRRGRIDLIGDGEDLREG